MYEHIYSDFLQGKLAKVVEQCDSAISKYPVHELNPKFRLLKAYAKGKMYGVREFKVALQDLVKNTQACEEKTRASELIAYFNTIHPVLKEEDEEKVSAEIYQFSSDETHLVLLALEKKGLNTNQVVFDIINFNLDHYPQAEFETKKQDLDNRFIIVTVTGLDKLKKAQTYLDQMQKDITLKKDLAGKVNFQFIISLSNYKTFLKDKSISVYEKFYKNHYLEIGSTGEKSRDK